MRTGTCLFSLLTTAGLVSTVFGQVGLQDEAGRLVLRNEQSTMVLDKDGGGAIVSLVDNVTGRELVARDPATPLFRLGLSRPGDTSGELIWLTSRDAEDVAHAVEERGSCKVARLTFKKLGGRQLKADCTVSVSPENGKFLWQLAVEGPEALILERVEFPSVVLRVPSREDDADDAFVAGSVKGGVYPQPSQWPVGSGVGPLSQPGPLAAQFGCYYDASCGFYSATQDSRGYPKRLRSRRTASGIEFIWERCCYHELAKPFELGYAVAQATFRSQDRALPTDWRDAADLYKAWALKQPWCTHTLAERDDVPDWLKEGPAMVRFRRRHTYYKPNIRLEYHPDWYSHLDQMEGWLKEYWQEHFPDVPLIVALWGWERFSSWISPQYFPPYPSEDGLRQRVKAIRDAGGHPFFWPSGYHWAVTFNQHDEGTFALDDREQFEKLGKPHAVATRDGSPFTGNDSWLNGGTNCVMCRGDAWSRRWLNETAMELTERGADLIQVDQVTYGCCHGDRGCCYGPRHGHPPGPGPWFVESFTDQLQTMRAECRPLNPDMILGFEGAQEFFLQQIGIQDYRDFELNWSPSALECKPASVFTYLYHEFLPFFQSNPEGFRGKPAGGNMLLMASSLVDGQMPHLVPHWPLQPTPALENGGFEQFTADLPDGWTLAEGPDAPKPSAAVRCDSAVKHGGRCSLRLENAGGSETLHVVQSIGVGEYEREVGSHGPEVRKCYRLSLWLKAKGLGEASRVSIRAEAAEGEVTGDWHVPLVAGDDWQRAEVTFTIPKRTVRLLVALELAGPCEAWVDDAALEELGDDGTYQVVMQKPILAAEHRLAVQWIKLYHGEGRPYLLLGRTVHPPRLDAEDAGYVTTQPIRARVPLHIYGSGNKIVQTAPINISGDTDWVQKDVRFTVPESAEHCTVHLFLQTEGRFWFDDICLADVDGGRELLSDGDFEQWPDPAAEPPGWPAAKSWGAVPCTGQYARDEEEKHGGKFAIRLTNGKKDVVHLSQTLPVDGKTLHPGKTYRLSLWMKVQDSGRVDHKLPAILHNAYRSPDGREAVIAVNITDKSQTGRLHWHGNTIDLKLSPWEARLVKD
ncbi:MAG: hypothetical protein GXX96_13405 [Planctomycetaceae bacterium]|nr:hypothetical protein [Planctomycetaceae bacterium]